MEGQTGTCGEAGENQQDFTIGPAVGALAEALDDVADQQPLVTMGAQADELLHFPNGLRVAFFAIEFEAELAYVVTEQNGTDFAHGLVLKYPQIAKLAVG